MTPTTSSAPSTKTAISKSSAPPRKRPPYIRAILTAIVLLVSIFFVLGYLKVQQFMGFAAMAKAGFFKSPPIAVTTTVASQSEWQPTLDTIGTVTAINGVTVSTDLAGIVDKIAFTSGTVVKTGDLLVHLNTDQEQAQLEQAQAQLALAQLTLNRDRDLLAPRGQSRCDLQRAAGVGGDEQRRAGGQDRFGLAAAEFAGRLRLQQVVHACRTAAGARVRHFDQV